MKRFAILLLAVLILGTGSLIVSLYVSRTAPPPAELGGVYPSVDPGRLPPKPGQIPESQAQSESEPGEKLPPSRDPVLERSRNILSKMTLREKVCQLFFVTPATLTGEGAVLQADARLQEAMENYPVGGVILMGSNVESPRQVRDLLSGLQNFSTVPLFTGTDEEGGRVSRLSDCGITPQLKPMGEYGAVKNTTVVRFMGRSLGESMGAVGFNLNFAPVADVVTNPDNTEIGDRSFSSDPEAAARMVSAMTGGLREGHVIPCLKHFPGHGSTSADSHLGLSLSDRTLPELQETELLPFRAGIEAGAPVVMISHMSLPQVVGDNTPCSLSPAIVQDLLRRELGFQGIVITDSLEMGAITERYGSGRAAVLALEAGCDMLLMPLDLEEAVEGILAALDKGELTRARLDESVLRILTLKVRWGLLTPTES